MSATVHNLHSTPAALRAEVTMMLNNRIPQDQVIASLKARGLPEDNVRRYCEEYKARYRNPNSQPSNNGDTAA